MAIDDIEAIAAFIARDSPAHAIRFSDLLLDRADSAGTFPELGRMVPEFSFAVIHEIFERRYRILYRIDSDLIHVIAVIHGARDLKKVWESESRGDPRTIT